MQARAGSLQLPPFTFSRTVVVEPDCTRNIDEIGTPQCAATPRSLSGLVDWQPDASVATRHEMISRFFIGIERISVTRRSFHPPSTKRRNCARQRTVRRSIAYLSRNSASTAYPRSTSVAAITWNSVWQFSQAWNRGDAAIVQYRVSGSRVHKYGYSTRSASRTSRMAIDPSIGAGPC